LGEEIDALGGLTEVIEAIRTAAFEVSANFRATLRRDCVKKEELEHLL